MMDPEREAAVWERVRAAAGDCPQPVRQETCERRRGSGVSVSGRLPLLVLAAVLLRAK